jgi:hypothetical protein
MKRATGDEAFTVSNYDEIPNILSEFKLRSGQHYSFGGKAVDERQKAGDIAQIGLTDLERTLRERGGSQNLGSVQRNEGAHDGEAFLQCKGN